MALPIGLTNPFEPSAQSLEGTLPPAYQTAMGELTPPEMEQVPKITLPQIIATSILATLAGALTDSPELTQTTVQQPFLRREAIQQRNVARQSEYERQRALLLREGAREAATGARQEEVAGIRAETQEKIAAGRAETQEMLERGRQERAEMSDRLAQLSLAIRQGQLENQEDRTKIMRELGEVRKGLMASQTRAAEVRTKQMSEADVKEFRAYARDYVAQAVTAIKNTPSGEEVSWAMYLPDRKEELTGAEEIKATILAYIDSTMKGSPSYQETRKAAEEELDAAIAAREE